MHEIYEVTAMGGPLAGIGAVIGGLIAYHNHGNQGGDHVRDGALAGAIVGLVIVIGLVASLS